MRDTMSISAKKFSPLNSLNLPVKSFSRFIGPTLHPVNLCPPTPPKPLIKEGRCYSRSGVMGGIGRAAGALSRGLGGFDVGAMPTMASGGMTEGGRS